MPHIDFSTLKLVSSNPRKLAEYKHYGIENLQTEAGVDLQEVDGTPIDVIIHKALAAGPNRIVEDSIITVEGIPYVDAKWRLPRVSEWFGKSAAWEVRLGVQIDDEVHVFAGTVEGVFVPERGEGWDYDPFFLVPSAGLTLAELNDLGRKDEASARRFAIANMIDGKPELVRAVDEIEPWQGNFQHP